MEYVYLHGKWQRSRGRNPSILFGNHTGPREAFEAARSLVGEYLDRVCCYKEARTWSWSKELAVAVMQRQALEEIRLLALTCVDA